MTTKSGIQGALNFIEENEYKKYYSFTMPDEDITIPREAKMIFEDIPIEYWDQASK